MGPSTPEERDDLIVKTIERSDGIGFNRLQKETGIPKKTLTKYLNEIIKSKTISKIMKGKTLSSGVTYTINFSESTKKTIKDNLEEIARYHQLFTDTKIKKSNTFPHYLQILAAEYYQNMISFLFDNVSAYKFGVKRLDELLDKEKKILDKEFKGKSKSRLWEACQEVQINLSDSAAASVIFAAGRNSYRTKDEIRIDCINPEELEIGIQQERLKKISAKVTSTDNVTLEKYRVDYIKDKKIKKQFIELVDEYDLLVAKISFIKYRLAEITGAHHFDPKTITGNIV